MNITNNNISATEEGIYIQRRSRYNNIIGNTIIVNVDGLGVYCLAVGDNWRHSNYNNIYNNTLINDKTSGFSNIGIYIDRVVGWNISNNYIFGLGTGIFLGLRGSDERWGEENNVSNNIIDSCESGIIAAGHYKPVIINNTITNSSKAGINLTRVIYDDEQDFVGTVNATLINNYILGNGIGIASTNSSADIYNNIVCGNTQDFNSSDGFVGCDRAWYIGMSGNYVCEEDGDYWDWAKLRNSTGDFNTCDVPDGWNDTGTTGCTYSCSQLIINMISINGQGGNNTNTSNANPYIGFEIFARPSAECNIYINGTARGNGTASLGTSTIIYVNESLDVGSYNVYVNCSTGSGVYNVSETWVFTVIAGCIDNDGDGYGVCPKCNTTSGCTYDGNDCNDNNASIHPGATEICNGVDDNCNNQIDEGVKQTFYRDADNDGYGNATNTIQACTAPLGYTTDDTDCNDNNNTIHPGATEICNGVDDNCNGEVDEGINCGQDTCSCSNCMECNEKLNNVSCFIVTLTSNILNYSGTCINNPSNFTNKIFDCHRYTIEGNKTKDSYGILLSKKSNSTIRNCIITDFDYGIYLYASLENKIINNTLNSNNYGIYVSSPSSLSCSGYGYVCIHSSYGDYVYSVIEKKFVLISSGEQSSNNEISNNSACENEISDISLNNENENFGNNICDKISNNSNNNLVFCSKNCSSSELQKMLFLYYCDDDGDSYFSKFISGYCFGDDSCIPINCSLDRGNDCNDGNSSIHPGAEEIICNGIDEDCDNFDKCGKRIWSSDKYMHEKNTFYSYEDVYVSGTGFDANREIEIYIIPHKNSINLSDFKIKKNITTDENGNFVSLLWNLPAWNELSVMHYDIIADENLDGIYESGEAIDASPFGFSVDPVWASDENGNPKETFCENEAIYVYGKGLPVKNKNITLYFVPYVKISPGSKFCYRGECINVTHPVKAEIDENGNFRNVVLGWGNAKPGEYNVVPDLNNNGIFDELNNKAMDDSYFTGFGVEKKFDFDNNRVIDIFDAVAALENLSEEKIICNNRCSDVNDNGIDLQDIFYLMERITN